MAPSTAISYSRILFMCGFPLSAEVVDIHFFFDGDVLSL
jgi:hypothetical protein